MIVVINCIQAYGSAVNDTRGQPGSSGRSGPPQSSLPQGSGFYQPSVANMRPQQSQQGHTASQQVGIIKDWHTKKKKL